MNHCLFLDPDRFAHLRGAIHLQVNAGTLWLTIDSQPDDLVLERGQGVDLPRGAHVLAQALGAPARLCVQQPDPWWRRLGGALTRAWPLATAGR